MANVLELFALMIGFVVAAATITRLSHQIKAAMIATACLAVLLAGSAQPALAGAVNGDVLTPDQKELNETLQTTPQGNQYQGIEYANEKGIPLSDEEITGRVKREIPDHIKLSVSNGSVRISGKVSDINTAQAIVQDIKEIPGVHEISYDLGIANS